MPDPKEESSGFKVVDRRGFTSEGTRREEAEPQPSRPAPVPARAAEPPPPESKMEEGADAFGPPGIEMIISYLSTTALFQLGLIPGPGGEHIPPDLENGRRSIDMLEILQQKTRGNLTATEAQMLENVLYELRMSCVELEKRLAKPTR